MGLTGADEFRHTSTGEPNWQENYMFMGWDEDRQAGIYLHLGHLPDRGIVDTRVIVSVGDQVASAGVEHAAGECLGAPWIDADITDPMRRWRLRCSGTGVPGRDPEGWLASDSGDLPVGFDIELESLVPPVDWTAAWSALQIPNIMTEHYEAGARWKGRVWIGGSEVACEGWLVRDHSWGPRDLKNAIELAWWWPTVFQDGSYLTGVGVLRSGRWGGFVLQEKGDGPELLSDDPWVRPGGLLTPDGFDQASMLTAPSGGELYTFESRLHCPVYYETMGSHQLDDVLCRVTAPDGKVGFGDLELNLPVLEHTDDLAVTGRARKAIR